jgi:hypothetical protein
VTIFVGKPLTPEALGLVEAKSAQEIADRLRQAWRRWRN